MTDENICLDNDVITDDIEEPTFDNDVALEVSQYDSLIAHDDADNDSWSPDGKFRFSRRKFWLYCGPGLLMSIAYLDPGNLEADIASGSAAKYSLLWLLLLSTVLGFLLQSRTINLGVVTGRHLAQHCRSEFPRYVRIPLWLMTEIAIIGSDIQEVLGSAVAIKILSQGHIPLWAGTILTAVDTFGFLFLEQYGIRRLEAFFALLISTMSVTFGFQYFTHLPPQAEVFKGTFLPSIPSGTMQQAVGTIGSVIMPHNMYLHSALVLSRRFDRRNKRKVTEGIVYNTLESGFALLISFFINLFVVANFAHMDYTKCDVAASDIGISSAGKCMEANYGKYALYIWAVGLLASGQSSTCTGTYSGQFVMQGFLNLHVVAWKRALLTRAVAIGPAIVVALVAESGRDVDTVQEWLNILQSLQLPFAVLPVIYFTSSPYTMGKSRMNSARMNYVLYTISGLVMTANAYLVVDFLGDGTAVMDTAMSATATIVVSLIYCSLFAYLLLACFGLTSRGLGSPVHSYDHLMGTATSENNLKQDNNNNSSGGGGGGGGSAGDAQQLLTNASVTGMPPVPEELRDDVEAANVTAGTPPRQTSCVQRLRVSSPVDKGGQVGGLCGSIPI
eukprot:PhM_4_TR6326/c0_g1_i3/m.1904/K21398/SLC11A2, DMT1, NRAMP2; natural resistance-associated macrophage protein 2